MIVWTGPTGPQGPATVAVGLTTTLDPGVDATVTNIGTDENVVLSIKDEGKDFNPTVVDDEDEFSNIAVLNKIAERIDYARVIGLNSTVITLERK